MSSRVQDAGELRQIAKRLGEVADLMERPTARQDVGAEAIEALSSHLELIARCARDRVTV